MDSSNEQRESTPQKDIHLAELLSAFLRDDSAAEPLAAALRERVADNGWAVLRALEHALDKGRPLQPWLEILGRTFGLASPGPAATAALALMDMLKGHAEDAQTAAALVDAAGRAVLTLGLACRGRDVSAVCPLLDALLDIAQGAHGQVKHLAAAALLKAALGAFEARDLEALLDAGNGLYDRGMLNKAISAYKVVALLQPSIYAYFNLGRALYDLNELPAAAENYRKALPYCGSRAEECKVRNNLGDVAYRLQDFRAAEAQYRLALSLDRSYTRANYNLGLVLCMRECYDEGIAQFDSYISKNPRSGDAFHARGLAHRELGQTAEAKKDFETAAKLGYTDARGAPDRPRPAKKGGDSEESFDPAALFSAPPKLSLDDFVGARLVDWAQRAIVQPFKNPALARRFLLYGPKRLLLYSAPGLGKSFFAACLAGELGARLARVSSAHLLSKWVGESEDRLAALCQYLGAQKKPAVVVLEEASESFASERGGGVDSQSWERKITGQLLSALDGLVAAPSPAVFILTSNNPSMLDRAVLRAGRVDVHLYFEPPEPAERIQMFSKFLKKLPAEDGLDFTEFAQRPYTGSEVRAVVELAAQLSFEESAAAGAVVRISQSHLAKAADLVRPKDLAMFLETEARFLDAFRGKPGRGMGFRLKESA